MKRMLETKCICGFFRTKKVYLPFCLTIAVVLLWIGIDLWRRWKMAALIIGILITVMRGCKDVRLFKAS
jgi:hypothetical protein